MSPRLWMTPQPRRRWLLLTQCSDCGRVLLGRSRPGGRGQRKYGRHWRDEHGGRR